MNNSFKLLFESCVSGSINKHDVFVYSITELVRYLLIIYHFFVKPLLDKFAALSGELLPSL